MLRRVEHEKSFITAGPEQTNYGLCCLLIGSLYTAECVGVQEKTLSGNLTSLILTDQDSCC